MTGLRGKEWAGAGLAGSPLRLRGCHFARQYHSKNCAAAPSNFGEQWWLALPLTAEFVHELAQFSSL
jgi:hypothetical protein